MIILVYFCEFSQDNCADPLANLPLNNAWLTIIPPIGPTDQEVRGERQLSPGGQGPPQRVKVETPQRNREFAIFRKKQITRPGII